MTLSFKSSEVCWSTTWISSGSSAGAQLRLRSLFWHSQALLRTLRREDLSKRCDHLDLYTETDPWTLEGIRYIMDVCWEGLDYNTIDVNMGWEYVVKSFVLHVPRLCRDTAPYLACNGVEPSPKPQA